MAVHGLNQELAANVVNYREKKGPFHTVEDLIKVSEAAFKLPNFTFLSIFWVEI